MEEQRSSGNMDNPETQFATPHSSAGDACPGAGIASPASPEPEEKMPSLAQRLAEAFREGVASARPDSDRRPNAGIEPRTGKTRKESSEGRRTDQALPGEDSASVVGEKATSVLGAFVQRVKKAPDLTQKYVDAFRTGAASLKAREGRERGKESPTAAKGLRAPTDLRALRDRVLQAGESAVVFVREAVSVVKPGEAIGVRQQIRLCQKKINNLYIDIGGEAVSSWNGGLMETEKLAALLDDLRENEGKILNLQAQLADVAVEGKTGKAGSPQAVKKAAAVTPATDKEDRPIVVAVASEAADPSVSLATDTVPEMAASSAPPDMDGVPDVADSSAFPETIAVPEAADPLISVEADVVPDAADSPVSSEVDVVPETGDSPVSTESTLAPDASDSPVSEETAVAPEEVDPSVSTEVDVASSEDHSEPVDGGDEDVVTKGESAGAAETALMKRLKRSRRKQKGGRSGPGGRNAGRQK